MKVLQSIARAFAGDPPPHAPPPRVEALDLSGGLNLDSRQEAALRLMDEDCSGYVLLTVHRDEDQPTGRIDLIAAMRPEWWPAAAATLARIVEAVRGRPAA
jgi:hypothetical protein